MACPYFLPEGRLETGPWTHQPRWPLGGAFSGKCLAIPGEPHQPSEQQQEELCNCGYARGVCEKFPSESKADAMRFSVVGDKPRALRLVYILEKNHAPVEFGELEYAADGSLLTEAPNEILKAQAEAFVRSYTARRARMRSAGAAATATMMP